MQCSTCKYLVTTTHVVIDVPNYFCSHNDVLELGSNKPGIWIGFLDTQPEWCPLLEIERFNNLLKEKVQGPKMHYMICLWDQENLLWRVMHYTTTIDDMERMMKQYPENAGYVHLIDLKFMKGHELLEKVKAFRERSKNNVQN